MQELNPHPLTPDFEVWPVTNLPVAVSVDDGALAVTWSDGRTSRYHPLLLAENDPGPETLHPLSRETILSPLDLPEDLQVAEARLDPNGAVEVLWTAGRGSSRFHPGGSWGTAGSRTKVRGPDPCSGRGGRDRNRRRSKDHRRLPTRRCFGRGWWRSATSV